MSNNVEEINPGEQNEEILPDCWSVPVSESIDEEEVDWEILNSSLSKRHWFKQNFCQRSFLRPSFITYH